MAHEFDAQEADIEEFLDEDAYSGLDVLSMNIRAGRSVAKAVRTTLGPIGRDKLVVDADGMGMPTNNGASILKELPVEHPASKMVIDVAIEQENEIGDGTTASVVLAGALLEKAEDLLEKGLHPTAIVEGYHTGLRRVTNLFNEQATKFDVDDEERLRRIASTAITGKHAERADATLSALVVEAVRSVADNGHINIDDIQFETVSGGRIDDSDLVRGVIVGRKRAHAELPFEIEDASIALLDKKLELDASDTEMDVTLSNPEELDDLITDERHRLEAKADGLFSAGADAVISSQYIDDRALSAMIREGLYVVRNTARSDINTLSKALDARLLQDPTDVEPADLGQAGRISQHFVGGEEKTIVQDIDDGRTVTIILRGSTQTVLDEVHRTMEDAVHAVKAAITEEKILPGGGAAEEQAATDLYEYATQVSGREQLAVEGLADALEVIPAQLAKNAGVDSVDAIVDIRKAHQEGDVTAGVDAYTGEVANMIEADVYEPLAVKRHAVQSAIELASMILRIDDLIPTAAEELEQTGWQGGDIDQELVDYHSRSKSM